MKKAKILIVKDEVIVAKDLENVIPDIGYDALTRLNIDLKQIVGTVSYNFREPLHLVTENV